MLLAATFVSGIAAGVYYERHTPRDEAGQMNAHDAMHRLALDLDLDPAQQQTISEIFARHQKDLDASWHALQPHVRATLDSTHEEIIKVLRPEQADRFRKLVEAMHPAGHR